MHLSEADEPRASGGNPVWVRKLGHVVLWVRDVERSTKFYTEVLNFRVSDVNEKGMVFSSQPAATITPLPSPKRPTIVRGRQVLASQQG